MCTVVLARLRARHSQLLTPHSSLHTQIMALLPTAISTMIRQAVTLPSRMAAVALPRGILNSAAMALPVYTPVPGRGRATNTYSAKSSAVSADSLPRRPLPFFSFIEARFFSACFSSHSANFRTGLMGRV